MIHIDDQAAKLGIKITYIVGKNVVVGKNGKLDGLKKEIIEKK